MSDIFDDAPLLAQLPADEASHGTIHKFIVQDTAPTVGFRSVNEGRVLSASGDREVTATLEILDGTTVVDKAQADAYKKGGKEGFTKREATRHLKALLFKAEKQVIGGTVWGDAAGFAGFANQTYLDNKNDTNVVDATGTTANTGSSVWLIRTGEDAVCAIVGNGGNIEVSPTYETVQTNATAALDEEDVVVTQKSFPAYATPITAYLGVQVADKKSIVRICNITEDSGKGCTDTLLYKGIAKLGKKPSMIVMSKRSLRQLRESRTTYSPTGSPAPIPTELEGIPIIATDAQIDTEALLANNA